MVLFLVLERIGVMEWWSGGRPDPKPHCSVTPILRPSGIEDEDEKPCSSCTNLP
jgi:hypothetical protein